MEEQIKSLQIKQQPPSDHIQDDHPPHIKHEEILPEELDPLSQHGGNKKYYDWDFVTQEIEPGSNQVYGSSSTIYFINQLSSYLDAALQHKYSRSQTLSPSLIYPTAPDLYKAIAGGRSATLGHASVPEDLSRSEEERLLELYWRTIHVLYPILDEEAFRAYNETLWNSSNTSRDPSILVDIMLALCMQHEAAVLASRIIPDESSQSKPTDSTAGWWFYRKCQYMLQDDLEAPSITVFQCHFLAVVWLSRAQWNNTAHSVLAAGLRIGVSLGLHLEPGSNLPPATREHRKRLWWTMYVIDANFAMSLGRPLGVDFGQVTCSLPKDNALSTTHRPGMLPTTSLNTQLIHLYLANRAIYIQFHRVCAQVLRQSGQSNLYHDLHNLELCAEWLHANTNYLKAWIMQVPEALKTPRENMGQPYSTDRSKMVLDATADIMSRDRLVLEILYHQCVMSLYRPFITFMHDKNQKAAMTERHAISCVNHANTITLIIHQDITKSNNLKALQMVCLWQWNTALSLAGYILTYPYGPASHDARQTLNMAVMNFDILSTTFTHASSAARALRGLLRKIDMLLGDYQLSAVSSEDGNLGTPSSSTGSAPDIISGDNFNNGPESLSIDDKLFSWTCPEFNLPEFSSSEDGTFSEDWAFRFLGLSQMDDQ